MTEDGRLSTLIRYDNVLEEQVFISYLCHGISFEATDAMCPHDRQFILLTLQKYKQKELEALKTKKKN